MKTKEEIQKAIATASSTLWALRGDILGLKTVTSTLVAEIVGDVSDTLDNCAELLNQCKQ